MRDFTANSVLYFVDSSPNKRAIDVPCRATSEICQRSRRMDDRRVQRRRTRTRPQGELVSRNQEVFGLWMLLAACLPSLAALLAVAQYVPAPQPFHALIADRRHRLFQAVISAAPRFIQSASRDPSKSHRKAKLKSEPRPATMLVRIAHRRQNTNNRLPLDARQF
jgi:hypothetical protein